MMRIVHPVARRVMALVLGSLLPTAGCQAERYAVQEAVIPRCSATTKDPDPWLEAVAERIRTRDDLFRQLVAGHGAPSSCKGGATQQFDTQTFGSISFEWRDGMTFTVQTFPPESSIIQLALQSGLSDRDSLVRQIQGYLRDRGISIDWATPRTQSTTAGRVLEFASASPGMNAQVTLEYDTKDRLVAIRIALAL